MPNDLRPTRRSVCGVIALTASAAATGASPGAERVRAVVFDALGTLFDTAGIAAGMEAVFPGTGGRILDAWRQKQLEDTWLSASARQYIPLATLGRQALEFAVRTTGGIADEARIARALALYADLPCFPDVRPGLAALGPVARAILSASGGPLLDALARANDLQDLIPLRISTDVVRTYKPAPQTYALACAGLGLGAREVMLVSSNGFDVWGAARAGLQTAWLHRPTRAGGGLYDTLRGFPERLEPGPDHVLGSLTELPRLVRPVD